MFNGARWYGVRCTGRGNLDIRSVDGAIELELCGCRSAKQYSIKRGTLHGDYGFMGTKDAYVREKGKEISSLTHHLGNFPVDIGLLMRRWALSIVWVQIQKLLRLVVKQKAKQKSTTPRITPIGIDEAFLLPKPIL